MTVSADPIPTSRQIDWSQSGIPGGIPSVAAGTSVLDHGAIADDGIDDTAAFQAAINAVKGTVANAITIPAGTFHINQMLTIDDSVVLRGISPADTHLKLGVNGRVIDIVTYNRGDWVDVVSDVVKGSTTVEVSDASGFSVGRFFEIEQENDSAVMYTDPQWNQSWAANAVGQLGVVTAVNGNTLTLREPLNFDYHPALNIQIRDQRFVEYVGIEQLHLDRTGLSGTSGETIQWKNAAYVWLDTVDSDWTDEMHVTADTVYRCEVRDSYIHDSYDFGGGGHGYGVELGKHTTGCLIENNIFHTLRHAMMVHVGANGNVFGYNYSFDALSEAPATWLPPDISLHGHFPHANLFEGNVVFEVGNGDFWGPSGPHNTFLRNCVTGDGLWYQDHSNDQNLIGNTVLSGEFGQRSTDNSAITGIIEHGNYWNGTTQWDATIADQTLPQSYYFNGVPDFYGANLYPSIGGDMPPDCTNPAKARWDAGTPFEPPIVVTPTPTATLDPSLTPTSTPAATPTLEPTAIPAVNYAVPIYIDALGTGWTENSWGGTYTELPDPLSGIAGDRVWQAQLDGTWTALRFESDTVYTFTDYELICLDLYYESADLTVILRPQFDGQSGSEYIEIVPQGSSAWHTYCYDLASWQPSNFTRFDAFRIQDQNVGNQAFYVDNIVLANAAAVATSTPTPTATPTSAPPLTVTLDQVDANGLAAPLLMVMVLGMALTLIGILWSRVLLVGRVAADTDENVS